MEFELTYFEATVQHLSYYVIGLLCSCSEKIFIALKWIVFIEYLFWLNWKKPYSKSEGASGGVMVSNLQKWVRVSLGVPFIWPCATYKQKA